MTTYEGSSNTDFNIAEILDIPFRPPVTFTFPKCKFSETKWVKSLCQCSWFSKWKWLHYNKDKDAVFCHVCVSALKQKMQTSCNDPSFISKSFIIMAL